MSEKAYIYPITNRNKGGVSNPYLDNFIASLEEDIQFVNKKSPSDIGILNLLKFIFFRIDYIFLNWIEDLPDKKMGTLQCYLLVWIIFPFLHLKKTKIVWTLHNKLSHYAINLERKKWLFAKLIHHADFILTHASEGIDLIKQQNSKATEKVMFLHHPVNELKLPEDHYTKKTDLLIWGTVQKYKGVLEFFQQFKKIPELLQLKVVIAGKVPDANYYLQLKDTIPKNVDLINDYVPFDKLDQMIYESKAILFTYKENSILSSGALMDSLITGTPIIGPKTGAFNDLEKTGLVQTFEEISDIDELLKKTSLKNCEERLKTFHKKNNWKAFGKELKAELKSKLV